MPAKATRSNTTIRSRFSLWLRWKAIAVGTHERFAHATAPRLGSYRETPSTGHIEKRDRGTPLQPPQSSSGPRLEPSHVPPTLRAPVPLSLPVSAASSCSTNANKEAAVRQVLLPCAPVSPLRVVGSGLSHGTAVPGGITGRAWHLQDLCSASERGRSTTPSGLSPAGGAVLSPRKAEG